jgi:hypothetical protein
MDARMFNALDGFDLDLVGFDCQGEIEPDGPQVCPFKPGCGAGTVKGVTCPLMVRLAQVSRAPRRWQ